MSAQTDPIYVECRIRGALEDVWRLTQTPDLHERWDLRFTSIRYLLRPDDSQPQRFLYSTRIGFGIKIEGEGESMGERGNASGERTSALKFWSDDPKSLIRRGSGYWKYVPVGDGVRFITGYDYEVRFGPAGRLFDRVVFRPLLGWATAWSFDRLRLWIERSLDPGVAARLAGIHALARAGVGFVWLYHGLIPKLIFHHADEYRLVAEAGLPESLWTSVVNAIGLAEIALGLIVLLNWRSRWPLGLTIILMALALLGVAINSPSCIVSAFNPLTLNVLLALLALVGLIAGSEIPSAAKCLRRPEPAP